MLMRGNMRDVVNEDKIEKLTWAKEEERLKVLFCDGYKLKTWRLTPYYPPITNIDKLETKRGHGMFGGEKTYIDQRRVAEIDHGARIIRVYDKSIYPVLKQFGEEFGFEELIRDWPEAAEEAQAPIMKKPMTESVKVGTRYERIKPQE